MLRLTAIEQGDTRARPGPLRAGLVSITCLLRGLPLFFCAAPATPLRVLCIVALDTIHVLRYSQPLSRQRRKELGTFLDFQACTNAVWDRKQLCAAEYQALRQRLEKAGLGVWITEYLSRLSELETRRPPVGGDRRRFDDVRSYREAVARLSLAITAAIALNAESLEEAIQCDVLRGRRGSAVSNGDAMPDHRRRRRLRRGSVGGPAQFSDRFCVAAAGDRIDDRRGTVLWRKAAAFRRRCVSAGSRALCPYRGNDARRGCCRKRGDPTIRRGAERRTMTVIMSTTTMVLID